MADTNLSSTRLGTSDDASLCKGFALFPVGAIRAGVNVSDQSKDLINVSPQILLWKFNCVVGYQLIFGVCGPSYAIAFTMNGAVKSGSSSFQLSNDVTQAGFFVGITLRIYFKFTLSQFQLRFVRNGWKIRIEGYWSQALDVSFNYGFDLIALALDILSKALQKKGKGKLLEKVGDFSPALLGSWGLLDSNRGDFSEKGYSALNPTLDVPINIVPLLGPLGSIIDKLKYIGGSIECGPNVGLVIPVEITLQNIVLTDTANHTATFTPNLQNDPVLKKNLPAKEGTVNANGSTALNGSLSNVAVNLSHAPGFDIKVGVYYKITVCKVFDVGATFGFNLLDTLGIRPTAGPYTNTVSNTPGKTTTGKATPIPRVLGQMMDDGNAPIDATGYRLPRVAFDTSGVRNGAAAAAREAVLA